MKNAGQSIKSVLLGLGLLSASIGWGQSEASIAHIDALYRSTGDSLAAIPSFFHEQARIHTITYDSNGNSQINALDPSEYQAELASLAEVYDIHQEPLVLVARSYGALASYYYSVYTRLSEPNGTRNVIKSIQTAHLVYDNGWKISHLSVQNENPYAPISDDLWPEALTKSLYAQDLLRDASPALDTTPYDPNKVYNPSQVDEVPAYPGSPELYADLLKAFDVMTAPEKGYTPFTVVIEEDGQAVLKYVGDLSGTQITDAKNFVDSMLLWYPALKDKASVKCKLTFYLHENN